MKNSSWKNIFLTALLGTVLAVATLAQTPAYKFSAVPEAEKAMNDGQALHAKNDFAGALPFYQKALQLDPKSYLVAIFVTDIHYRLKELDKAAAAAAVAVAIDPNKELGYRFWGKILEDQQKPMEARDKYIEAYIIDPYNNATNSALIAWSNLNSVKLGHPPMKIPTTVSSEGDKTVINLDFNAILGPKNDTDGSSAWFIYGLTRASWTATKEGSKLSESFIKAYPNETVYRHSLAEEVDALDSVLTMLDETTNDKKKKKKIKELEPSLALLKKLHGEGLLEPYILLAKFDNGIKKDHPAYLAANRDKLRQYVVAYLMNGNNSR